MLEFTDYQKEQYKNSKFVLKDRLGFYYIEHNGFGGFSIWKSSAKIFDVNEVVEYINRPDMIGWKIELLSQ